MADADTWATVADEAHLLGIHKATIYRWIADGHITQRNGLVNRTQLEAYAAQDHQPQRRRARPHTTLDRVLT